MRIYKTVLDPETVDYAMPTGAQVLNAREQGADICIWYMCDPKGALEPRRFHVFGTGHPIDDGLALRLRYIGTAHLSEGALVFHVFEEP